MDLIVLVADKNTEFAIKGLLTRGRSLGIRELSTRVLVHPQQDGGCRVTGHELLRSFHRKFQHALVVFDHEGCGDEGISREDLEQIVEERLQKSGWENRAAAIVIHPELENWVWSDSPEVDQACGWTGRQPDLRTWLQRRGFLSPNELKPIRPKEALESALREVRKPRSSAIYHSIAERVSLKRCTDPAFLKFKWKLGEWFPG